MWYQSKVVTKGMADDGEINTFNTQASVTQDLLARRTIAKRGMSLSKTKRCRKIEPNEGLTSQEPSSIEMRA